MCTGRGNEGCNKLGKLKLIDFVELPDWMQDNEFITSMYRPPLARTRDCVRTAFLCWHNDSINIWSHALGFLFYLSLTVYVSLHLTNVGGRFSELFHTAGLKVDEAMEKFYHAEDILFDNLLRAPAAFHGGPHLYDLAKEMLHSAEGAISGAIPEIASVLPGVSGVPTGVLLEAYQRLLFEHRLGMLPMLLGAMLCCLGSTVYHTFFPYANGKWNQILSRVDYCGIVLLIAGHSMMGTYYTFYCRPRLSYFYNIFVVVAMVPVLASFVHIKFQDPEFRTTRTLVFIAFGVVSALPVIHSGLIHQFWNHEFVANTKFLAVACIFYLGGGIFFASRFPERKAAGKFDTVCSSHQLLHICVLIGAFVHWYGSYLSLVYRIFFGCSLSPLSKY